MVMFCKRKTTKQNETITFECLKIFKFRKQQSIYHLHNNVIKSLLSDHSLIVL